MKFIPPLNLLLLAYGVSTFSEGILMPIYAIYVQNIGGDILNASNAIGVFLISTALFTYIFHKISWNKINRLYLLVIGWGIWSLGISSYLLVTNINGLLIVQIIIALGNAISNPIFLSEFSKNTILNKSTAEWSKFDSLNDLLAGLAAIVGGLVASSFGFNSLIIIMFVSSLLSLLVILFYLIEQKNTTLITSL